MNFVARTLQRTRIQTRPMFTVRDNKHRGESHTEGSAYYPW